MDLDGLPGRKANTNLLTHATTEIEISLTQAYLVLFGMDCSGL